MSSLAQLRSIRYVDRVGDLVGLQRIEPLIELAGGGPEDADELDCGLGNRPALDVDHPPPDRHVVLGQAEHLHAVARGVQERGAAPWAMTTSWALRSRTAFAPWSRTAFMSSVESRNEPSEPVRVSRTAVLGS